MLLNTVWNYRLAYHNSRKIRPDEISSQELKGTVRQTGVLVKKADP
jgi:hypothetical protein